MLSISDIREAKNYQSELNYFEESENNLRNKMESFRESVRKYIEDRFNWFIDQSKEKLYVWVYYTEGIIDITKCISSKNLELAYHYKLSFKDFEKIYNMPDAQDAFEEIKKHVVEY